MTAPDRGARARAAAAAGAIPLLLGAAMLLLSVRLGPDASWDLRNYHLYDAFAALRKPPFQDLVPAQQQSFNPPLLDLPSLWLRFRLNRWPNLLDALLALPSAVAVMLAWAIGLRLVPARRGADRLALLLAVLFGATGAAGLPTTGTSMSEMPAGCFALAGLLMLLDALDGRPAPRRLLGAGGLFGVAAALKLTLATLGLSALAALALCGDGGPRRRWARVALLGAGMAAGLVAVAGPWWWHMAALTGNPLFPYFNQLFRSPLLPPTAIADTRFLPRSLGQALAYPFIWGFTRHHVVAELTLRDPRVALALLAGLVCASPPWAPWRSLGRRGACLLVFCGTGFVLWEAQFSILRYLAPIELLSGLPVLLALRRLAPPAVVPGLLAIVLAACAAITIYPDWGRAHPADTAASVVLPPLPVDAMVLLLTGDPMAYVAAYAAPSVRFVGIDDNLVHPGDGSLLEQRIERVVRGHHGPLYGLEVPVTAGPADTALRFYGLRRLLPCAAVRTNLEQDGLRICALAPTR